MFVNNLNPFFTLKTLIFCNKSLREHMGDYKMAWQMGVKDDLSAPQ